MQLTVERRDIKKSPKTLRKQGLLPAVVYGRKEESTPIIVDRKVFEKVFHAAGESSVITLLGLGEDKDALIHEVAVDPVTGVPIHADFYAIAKGQTVTVSVPFEFAGESGAVRDKGGILLKVMHDIEIECEPKDLPRAIHIDISKLEELDSKITVGDIAFPLGAKISAGLEEVIAMITEAKEEPVEEVAADISAIEISEERGKKLEDLPAQAGGAEGAAAPAAEAPKVASKEKKK
jgi:large subunit ribosomal protein L25